MPIFELQGPDGKTYEVDAPDMGAAANAFGEMAGPSVGDLSVRNVATAAARGVPILGGLVDEAIAGGQALAGNGSYAENLKAEQDRQAAFDAQHPYWSTGAQIVGGVAAMVPAVMAAPAAFGAGAGGLVARSAISAGTGAVIGGADSAVRSNGDLNQTMTGAGLGAAFGGAAPAVGGALGSGINRLSEATRRYLAQPGNSVTGGISPAAMRYAATTIQDPAKRAQFFAELKQLGEEAMLADVSPEWMGIARGAASRPGQRDAIVNPLLARDATKNARLGADLNASLGQTVEPSSILSGIEANQQRLGPVYGEAFKAAGPVDTSALAGNLDEAATILRGPAQRATTQVRGMLNAPGVVDEAGNAILDSNPSALFQIRQAIDGLLATEQNPQVIRQLTASRKAVDDELARAVPGIKGVDAQYAELARQGEGLKQGAQVFDSGKTAIRPQDMRDQLAASVLPQGEMVGPSAVPLRMQQGARAEVDRLVGQASNDPAKLQQVMRGEGDWNREKLRTLFGQDRADQALNAVDRETTFYRTNNRVTSGSDTAMAQRFGDFLDAASTPNTVPTDTTLTGSILRAGQSVLRAGTKAQAEQKAERFASELGKLSVAQGGQRDAILQSLQRMVDIQELAGRDATAIKTLMNAVVRSAGPQLAQ